MKLKGAVGIDGDHHRDDVAHIPLGALVELFS